ncbi:23S rRNA (uracil(1939)-C(5))-methyltransferase RlmD [Ferrimonas pelagia]|uniref:23S rRNA (uracil(1939)-C(5))-methyltransferase RlmD n=1 Tax=Ferrimonas pelagia TaxID=1177826 RepID=A0ABP9FB89_9GAMM
MAQFYSPKSKKTKTLPKAIEVTAESLDHQAKAVCHHQGKVIFTSALLPGERAKVQLLKDKARFGQAKVVKRLSDSPARVSPACRYFAQCGGCQLQYAAPQAQRQMKGEALQRLVQHHVTQPLPELAPPLMGADWHYRRRARIGVRMRQGQLVMGFRQESSNELVDIDACPVLAAPLSELIAPLKHALARMALARHVGHVDLLLADEGPVAVLRILRPLKPAELERLVTLEGQHALTILLQDEQGVKDLQGQCPAPMHYSIGEGRPAPAFLPGDFFQINDGVNRAMIDQAIEWLAPQPDEAGLDLFCGGGNFSFALAAHSREVIGVEGIDSMVERARRRAEQIGLNNTAFYAADLNGDVPDKAWLKPVDWVLLDPARAGAFGVLKWMNSLAPKRILYVSCDPLSLAKDSKVLEQQGYYLKRLGLVDMFPHTHHLESMALFVPKSEL